MYVPGPSSFLELRVDRSAVTLKKSAIASRYEDILLDPLHESSRATPVPSTLPEAIHSYLSATIGSTRIAAARERNMPLRRPPQHKPVLHKRHWITCVTW